MTVAEETGILGPLRQLLSNRQSPEARALYIQMAQFAHSRVRRVAHVRYADLLSPSDQEDIVSEVMYQLTSGTLARFRGQTIGELLAFVRTVTDRSLWRSVQKRIRERDTLSGNVRDEVRAWGVSLPAPDDLVLMIPESPLSEPDSRYLLALVRSGSQAEFARSSGVSRAAVTQRIQRIKKRIQELSERDQDTAELWLRGTVTRLSGEPTGS